MRHMKAGRKLGRNSSHRKALYRNMVTSLMLYGSIRTTEAKAKEIRVIADRMITLGKRVPPSSMLSLEGAELAKAKASRVHAIRLARRFILDRQALDLVFNEYAERYQGREGGYARVLRAGFRPGDNASMSILELVPAIGGDDVSLSSSDDQGDAGSSDSAAQDLAPADSDVSQEG